MCNHVTPHRFLHDRLTHAEYQFFMTRFNLSHSATERQYALVNGMAGMAFASICGDNVTATEMMGWLLTPVDEADIVASH